MHHNFKHPQVSRKFNKAWMLQLLGAYAEQCIYLFHLSLFSLEQGSRVQHSCFFYMQTYVVFYCWVLIETGSLWFARFMAQLPAKCSSAQKSRSLLWLKELQVLMLGTEFAQDRFHFQALTTCIASCMSPQEWKCERFLCSVPVSGYLVSCPSTQQRCNLSQSPILLVSLPGLSLTMLSFFCFACCIPYLVAIASPAVGVLRSCRRPNAYCSSIICWGNWSIVQGCTSNPNLNLKAALWLAVNNMGFYALLLHLESWWYRWKSVCFVSVLVGFKKRICPVVPAEGKGGFVSCGEIGLRKWQF